VRKIGEEECLTKGTGRFAAEGHLGPIRHHPHEQYRGQHFGLVGNLHHLFGGPNDGAISDDLFLDEEPALGFDSHEVGEDS
jgi:hypothetical protein